MTLSSVRKYSIQILVIMSMGFTYRDDHPVLSNAGRSTRFVSRNIESISE
jgi:hypothetical protein